MEGKIRVDKFNCSCVVRFFMYVCFFFFLLDPVFIPFIQSWHVLFETDIY